MKQFILSATLLFCTLVLKSQVVYHDASVFPLLGKATSCSENRYIRLPDSLEHISRAPLWKLGQNSAGLALRFRSNSTRIAAQWEVLFDNAMNHMTPTGIKGVDLYCLQEGQWVFVNSGRPTGKVNRVTIVENMKPLEREYMLYLPLYDGVASLSIGVDSLAELAQPMVRLPVREKPVVMYGTSILQGGCANRPGMAHTNIISRRLNRECINLGFSGNALLDLEIAHVMAAVDASVYVLDFVPNASVKQMDERVLQFYTILRNKHPRTPILFIEDPIFTHTRFDQRMASEVSDKNEKLRALFNALKERGEKNIHLIPSKEMLGHDGEATIDGVHFTDLGMMRYADLVCPIIKKHL